MNESSEQQTPKNLQEQIDSIWQERVNWNDGLNVQIEGLPEGLRLVEIDSDTLIMRSLIPNAPINERLNEPNDVPVGVFSAKADPEEIKKEAIKIGTAIVRGEVQIDKAKIPSVNIKK